MRFALGVFLILHGIAHLVGFFIPWRLLTAADLPYRTTILAGSVDVGDMGIRSLGVGWLLLGIAVVLLGFALLAGNWSYPLALTIIIVSLALCIVGLPDARIGLAVNAILLVLFMGMKQFEWMPFYGR